VPELLRPNPPRCNAGSRGNAPARRSTAGEDRTALSRPGRQSRADGEFPALESPRRGQTQIQRGDDHADFEAAVFQQDVIHGHGQQVTRKSPLAKPRRNSSLASAVVMRSNSLQVTVRLPSALRMARSLRPVLRPLRHYAMQQMAIGKKLLVIVEGKLRHAHRFTHPRPRAAVVVAHPDDETLWCGGYILTHPEFLWRIVTLCRAQDSDRAPKFRRSCSDWGGGRDGGSR
jgi:hypothetical protein